MTHLQRRNNARFPLVFNGSGVAVSADGYHSTVRRMKRHFDPRLNRGNSGEVPGSADLPGGEKSKGKADVGKAATAEGVVGRAAGRRPSFLVVLIAAIVLLLAGAPAQALEVSAPDTPTAPLTAEISDEPESHNGTDAFTFRVAFSENIAVSLAEFRDHTFETTNGSVTGARRIGGRGDLWEITVQPDSDADVVVELPKTKDCNAQGAVCTAAGAKLSTRLELRVGGPRGQEGEQVYTFEDGDRTVRVILQGDLVVSETGADTPTDDVARRAARGNIVRRRFGQRAADLPVFRSASGGALMTLPGGVLLALDPEWDETGVNGFFARNNISRARISELDYIPNGFLVRTEPGFPSLELANALATQKGVVVSSPNWWREAGTRQDPEETNSDGRVTAQEDGGIELRNDGLSEAWDLRLDGTYSDSIDPPEDYDFFKLDLSSQTGDTVVRIYTTGEFDTAGILTDSDEMVLMLNDDSIGTHNFSLLASLSPGVYYVIVFGAQYAYGSSSTDTGNYTLHAETLTATSVSLGSSVAPSIGAAGELDYFELDLSGQTGDTDVSLFTVSDDIMPFIKASSGSLDALRTVDALGERKWVVHWSDDGLAPGAYRFSVGSRDGDTGDYSLRAAAVPDHGGTTATATTLSLDAPTSGKLTAASDTDYFELELAAAKNLVILAFAHVNAVMLDSGGTEIPVHKETVVGGFNRIIDDFASGTYYVKITSATYISDSSLVSNTSQAAADSVSMSTSDYAQAFTTGARASGYTLSSVEVVSQDPEGDSFTVALYTVDDDGRPNTFRALLTAPNSFAAGTLVFTAPANTTLRPNTTYALVFGRTFGSTARVSLGSTTSDGEDSDAAAGWSIANTYYYKQPGSTVWQETATNKSIRIAIEGPATAEYALYAYEDTGYGTWVDGCTDDTNDLGISTINDPLYACQWHLNSGGGGDMDINVESVWADSITGEGISVAVVDDTIDYSHDDLSANINSSLNHDYGGRSNAYRPADHHGTNVAGVIAARDNTIGVRGVTPRATIYGYNLLGDGYVHLTVANSADAMARNRVATAVSNNSWGPPDGYGLNHAPAMWNMAIDSGVTEGYADKGVFYAWAGGNGHLLQDNSNFDEFANYYGVTAVCAVSDAGIRSHYSEQGANLWVCAPSSGGDLGIVTTDNSDRYTNDFGGTSSATPKVSGVAALLRHANPDLTWRDLKLILAASARQNDPTNAGWEEGARKYDSTDNSDRYHFNHEYGFGVVDAAAAVALARDWNTLPEFQNASSASGTLNRTIPDSTASGITSSLSLDTEIDFAEFVEVNVTIDHTYWRDLQIELESPAGTVSTLAVASPSFGVVTPGTFRFGSAKHLGENPNGQWTLRVADVGIDDDGRLESWSIKVYGHRGATPVLSGAATASFAENGGGRVATYTATGPAGAVLVWTLEGTDAGLFSIDEPDGALRFMAPPDFENPAADSGSNVYSLTVVVTDRGRAATQLVVVTVTDQDEPGTVALSANRPRMAVELTASVTDPDVDNPAAAWQWERSSGRTAPGRWTPIEGATEAAYTPVAADAGDFLRVTATYDDGGEKAVQAATANVVAAQLLTGLQATTQASTADSSRALRPAFSADVLHYAIGCGDDDTMALTLSAEVDARLAVDGVQAASGDAVSVPVTGQSDVSIAVTGSDGAGTTYTVHCLADDFFDIEAIRSPGATDVMQDLILMSRGNYVALLDNNGVPRFRQRGDRSVGAFFRLGHVGDQEQHRYSYIEKTTDADSQVVVLDEHFARIDTVSTVSPLNLTDSHDQWVLPDGNYLVMSYEPATRDLSHLTFDDSDDNPYGPTEQVRDSAIQIVTPGGGSPVFDWNSWDHMALEDCAQHRFPDDYAHLNSMQLVEDRIIGSFRGCSKVLAIDAGTGEVVWRIGRSNLSAAQWAERDIGPAPLTVVRDPEGEFCGQHAAQILPTGNLILFDNGAHCTTNPWEGGVLGRTSFVYSRAVEYALDLDNGEAVFLRDHSPRGERNRIGQASGHVDVLGNGDWLISWGKPVSGASNQGPGSGDSPYETVTQVDPDTGEEKFALVMTHPGNGRLERFRAIAAPPSVLARTLGSLTATIAGSPWTSEVHSGTTDRPRIVVVFDQPVVDAHVTASSANVTGAGVESVGPWIAEGAPANAYAFVLRPAGLGPITFSLAEGTTTAECGSGGICTAGRTRLSSAPTAHEIPSTTNANAAPSFSSSATFDMAENGTAAGTVLAADSDSDDDITGFAISGGADQALFSIGASSGALTFDAAPNYENPRDQGANNTYVVEVTATSGTGTREKTATQTITVRVTDVNTEAPAKPGAPSVSAASASSLSVSWSAPANAGPAITDYDVRYRAGTSGAWSDAGHAGTAVTAMLTGLSENTSYQVQVSATNDEGTGAWSDAGSGTTDANAAPVFSSSATFSAAENQTSVGTVRATDSDTGDSIEGYALTGGADRAFFSIGATSGALTFKTAPNYEDPRDQGANNTYVVEVTATSGTGTREKTATQTITVRVTDVNEPPTITTAGSSAVALRQNENVTSRLYTYRATDPEGAGTVTWSVAGPDGGLFAIDDRGQLSFKADSAPDYERPADSNRDNVYNVVVQATDDGANTAPLDVTVTVADVNEGPEVTSGSPSFTVAENQDLPGAVYAGFDPEGGTVTGWTVGGRDGGDFAITQDGVLNFRSLPDYERPADSNRDNVYELEVRPYDGRHYGSFEVTVTVNDVNEPPTITTAGSSATALRQNENVTSRLYTYRATDPEGADTVTWSVAGPDGELFAIDESGQFSFKADSAPDYERPADSNRDNVYNVVVQATDDGANTAPLDVTVTVADVNEVPEIRRVGSAPGSVPENQDQSQVLARYTATDPENPSAETTRWITSGSDGGDFAINEQGELRFKNTPDYERPADSNRDNVYVFTVRVSDGRNYDSLEETVTVTDVNEPPTITTAGSSAVALRQNENVTSRLYTYRAVDPEGAGTVTWSVGGVDERLFAIDDRGQLSFKADSAPDYERPADSNRDNVYNVVVQATDDGANTAPLDVTVTVADVNEGPEVTSGSPSFTVAENQDLPGAVYAGFDPEGGTVTGWTVGGRDGGDFAITQDGVLNFRSLPDYERPADSNRDNVYELEVRPYDGRHYGSFEVTVTVNDVNEPPTITTAGSSATALRQPENRVSRLYSYRAADPEGADTVTWSVGGVDERLFAIDDRGQLSFKADSVPDYERPADSNRDNVYNVVVQATDDGANTAPLDVTVTVTDVNEGPEVSGPSTFTIDENENLSDSAYSATDPEGLNVARWSVGGRDGGDFFITQGGTLYFRSLPDYERPADSNRDNVYEVTIQPSDGRNTGSYPVIVTVGDGDEPPEIRGGSKTSFMQQENRTSRLYTYSATDPEGGTVRWSVAGPDGGRFTIDEKGQFSFKEDSPPDFDTPSDVGADNLYNVTVQARDPESNTASLPVTVTVTEVNEGPVISRQSSALGTVPENQAVTQVLATYTASDPEQPGVKITRWSTTGRDGGDFEMNALGQLMFRNPPDFERPADSDRDNVYEVTIRASDGRYTGTLEEVQTVTVTDVNEPPTITTTSRTAFTLQEGRTSTLYTFRATDPEGETVNWTTGGTDGSAFTIDERGALFFTNPPDFESPTDSGGDNVYNVTVQARDAVPNTAGLDIVVTVTDQNEGVEPTITTRRPPATYREHGTSAVYTFRASDPQRGTVITWTLEGTDWEDFTLTADSSGRGVLSFDSPPDFENPTDADRDNIYELAVVATDGDGHTDRVDFTVTVTDHNEGVEPTITTRRPPATYRENDTRPLYTLRASDPQRDTVAWRLEGTDSEDFTIGADSRGRGVLEFNSPPDFESPADSDTDNVYELAVVATDDDDNSDRVDLAITVTDVNEGPVISLELEGTAATSVEESLEGTAATSVEENTADTVVLADFTARDPEDPGASIFRWSTAGRDGGDFVVSDLGELRFRSSPDYERPADSDRDNVYEVTVRAYDGRVYGTYDVTVTVVGVNEAPVITTKSRTEFTLRENFTAVIYTYRVTDQDTGDAVGWSLEGADGGDFAIYDGMVTFGLLPDLENPVDEDEDNVYEIIVVAADGEGLRDTVGAVITVTDQSEGPVIAGTTSYTVAENYDSAQILGSYTATDAKDNRPVHPRWSLSGRDGGDFTINERGELTFRSIPDYDRPADSNRDNVYEVTVRGHDSRAYGNLNVMVRVTPVNEHYPVVTGRETLSFRENTPVTTRLHAYRATDGDRDTSFIWSLEGDDADDFAIAEGVLTFSRPPDYEQPGDRDMDNVYEVTVVASDDGATRGTLDVTVMVTEQNEGPVVSGTAEFTVTENRDLPNAVYTAQDPEAVGGVTTVITWRLSGRDGGDFTIDRETGVLTFRTPPDHERPADSNRDNVYEVTVRAHDGRNYGDFEVTVTVDDVAEITGLVAVSQEESFEGVLATYSAAGQGALNVEPSWRLSGTDSGDFAIDRETGVLTFRSTPDHERPVDSNRDNVYSFAVQVSDGSYHGTLDVTVTVTAVNEPPAVTGRDSLRFQENTPVTTRLYTYRATDPEGDAFTWGLDGPDANDFAITTDSSGRGILTFSSPPDFDSPAGSGTDVNQYLVTVQAQDDQGTTGELRVTVTVTDQNEGAAVTGLQAIAVQENRDPTLTLASYSALDPEGQPVTRWGLAGSDRGDFLISENGDLTFRNTPDYDRPADSGRDNEYRVTVRAYDGRTYGNLDITITVSNVNEHDPVIRSGSRTSFTYREEGTSVLYTYRATDQDTDDVITWTTGGSDGSLFEFNDRNALVFQEPPDFEDPGDSGADNEYELTVVATDSGGRSASLSVTVTVTELDEGPKVSGTATYTVPEGQDLTGAIFTARDPEDTGVAVTSWRLAGSDAGDFEITDTGQNSAQLTFRNTPDYDRPADSGRDNEYLVTIRAYNGSTYGSLEVTVTVTDRNEAEPVVTGRDSLSFRENTPATTRLYTYRATDMDLGATITWSVVGADGGDFTISTGGELFFRSIPDHEQAADADADNVYEIAVVASDGPNEGTLAVTVTVTGVDEGPEITGARSLAFDENTATDRVLAAYTGTDPEDPTAEVTRWSVTGRDGGDFSINEDGELTFRNPPDHERPADSNRDNVYEVTVRASDGRVYGTHDVTVTVESVDEAPEFRRGSRDSFSYRENGTASLYTYRATDPEGAVVEWSVSGADGENFKISDSGVLTFMEPPDHDDPADDDQDNEYQVTVVATDQTGHVADLPVTVTVTNANEGPVIADTGTNTAITVQENHDQVLATYTAADPEGQPVTRWSVTGRDGGDFSINEDGELTFRSPPDHERPADSNRDNEYEITVRASDGRYYGALNVTVTVLAVDEAPEFQRNAQDSFVYQENGISVIYTYRATDPEGSDVTWGLLGTDNSAFTMSETGVLSFNSPPDYESPKDSGSDNVYLVTVQASDRQSNTARLDVTVTVTNLTDARAAIRGTAQVGRTLTAETSGIPDKDSQAEATFSYRWLADDKDIEDATDPTYEITDEDEGKTIKVRVTFSDNASKGGMLTSAATAPVKPAQSNAPATGLPTINGTAQVGETLTADASGISDADGMTNAVLRYQWTRRDGDTDEDIEGATDSTHEVSDEDEGKTIKVRVGFSDDRGNDEALTSAATGTVAVRHAQ